MSASLLLRNARLPGDADAGAAGPVDITVIDGVITAIVPAGKTAASAPTDALPAIDLDGRWVVPGLWDNHVHFSQWAAVSRRLDVSAGTSAASTAALVGEALRASGAVSASASASGADASGELLVGYGFRDGLWPDEPTARMLDAVTGDRPVVLVSGDLHCVWVNSAMLRQIGLAAHPTGVLREEEAFAVHRALDDVPAETVDLWALEAAKAAAARGVVGIVDLEMAWNHETWTRRLAAGHDLLRVEFGVYPQHLDRAIAEGLRTGTPLAPAATRDLAQVGPSHTAEQRLLPSHGPGTGGPASTTAGDLAQDGPSHARQQRLLPSQGPGAGGPASAAAGPLVHVGPFKVITDGSLNTRTAYCFDEYPGLEGRPDSHGLLTVPPTELHALLERAVAAGFVPAVHAIGDHANQLVLDTFETLGCGGSLEHAQLVSEADFARFAPLGVVASVQPEHAMDDRDVAERYWPGRTDRSFALASLLASGATLAMGSDAPVAPLDPWVTMAAAVGRARDGREPWHPEQRIDAAAALLASTRGRSRIRVGDVADLAVTERDPLAATTTPEALRAMPVALTLLAGRATHNTL